MVGRIIFGLVMIVFGLFHFMSGADMAGFALPGWPVAIILVYVSGAALIAAGIAIVLKVKAKLASLLLALLLFIIIISVHVPSMIAGNEMAMSAILKDLGLAGGALVLASVFEN